MHDERQDACPDRSHRPGAAKDNHSVEPSNPGGRGADRLRRVPPLLLPHTRRLGYGRLPPGDPGVPPEPVVPDAAGKSPAPATTSSGALRIALVFAVCSMIWIGVTDSLIPRLSIDTSSWLAVSRMKGFVYVALCAVLLFVLVRRQHRRMVETNERLARQKEDFRAVFSVNPHPMWLYDVATLRFIVVNAAAVRAYGFSEAEFGAMTVRDLRPPEDEQRFLRYIESPAFKLGVGRWRHRRKDGSILYVDVRAQDTVFEGRRARIVVAVDVTEQLKIDQTVRLAQAAFDNTREAVMITTGTGTMVAVNPAFQAITGYGQEDCVGRRPEFMRSERHDPHEFRDIRRQLRDRGGWQGEIWCRRKDGSEFPAWLSMSAVPNAAGRVRNFIGIATDLSDRKEAEVEIHNLAHYDKLTLPPNRTLIEQQLDRLLAVHVGTQQELSVLIIDLDYVRRVNDSFGHAAGDALLRTAGARLSRLARDIDVVGRWGGDEFVMVLPGKSPTAALAAAESAMHEITAPCTIDGHSISMTASVGISVCPKDGTTSTMLLRNASAALHHAKEQGGNCAHFFRPKLNAAVRERHAIETALRLALTNREFYVHYQPQLRLADGAVVGMEALLRWKSPELGLVGPEKFIPIAESIGLMEPIGAWVLQEVCKQGARWRAECSPTLRLAVNVSAAQLRTVSFLEEVDRALAAASLEAAALEIELTEGMVVDPNEAVRSCFDALLARGVQFAIDDFGTGYSSLAYLRSLPVQAIKIDQSFIREMLVDGKGLALPQAIIAIGHHFGLRVVAEGVETTEQQAALLNMGCDEAQGFFFARPMSGEEATAWMRQRLQAASAATPLHGKCPSHDGRSALGRARELAPGAPCPVAAGRSLLRGARGLEDGERRRIEAQPRRRDQALELRDARRARDRRRHGRPARQPGDRHLAGCGATLPRHAVEGVENAESAGREVLGVAMRPGVLATSASERYLPVRNPLPGSSGEHRQSFAQA